MTKPTRLIVDPNISLSETEAGKQFTSPEFFKELKDLLSEIGNNKKFNVNIQCMIEPSSDYEIDKMLTLSTAHITENTATLLANNIKKDNPYLKNIAVYPKGDYGYFIYIIDEISENDVRLPADLRACLKYALDLKCSMLCLDRDGDTMSDLKAYNW